MKKKSRLLSLIFSIALVLVLSTTAVRAEGGNETSSAVAKINETNVEYETLAGAIDAVTSGQTITLLQNVEVSETLKIYKSITLDLGAYTITSSASEKAIYTTQTLTITATTGGITATAGSAITNQKGSGTGTLTINGGTYTSSAGHAIYNNNGTVIVNSGTISSTSEAARDGICCYADAAVTVNSGDISGTRYGIYSTSAVEIIGGNVSGTKAGVYLNGGTATISGGTIKGTEGLKGTSSVTSIVISGGTFEGTTHAVYVCNNNVIVSGGIFTATGTKAQYAVAFYIDGATVTFSGGTFSGMYSTAWIKSNSEGSYSIKEGYSVNTGTLTDNNSGDTALIRTIGLYLGGSSDSTTKVLAEDVSGEGTNTIYVKVPDASSYTTSNYPTTSLTFSDSDEGSHSYIFAGWYSCEDGVYTAMTSVPTNTEAYAKFVDADVLTVKCVFTYDVSGYGNIWRVLTSLDSLNYNGVYFTISASGSADTTTTATTKAYTRYEITGVNTTFVPSGFSSASNYVVTDYYADSEQSLSTCVVTASWVTCDGTTVTGPAATFTANSQTAVLSAQ